ncbi:hypothetical protein TRIUR3_09115 [Triticum urartu]|uniref:Ubiquitin-like protease family profile domain-containing protein n=1 Tax=Triticum urartu TaxID=4572 RepID=M7Z005_TRIUA|nr:hypothetical protein TRIUR3_09115 [Triticum urartu]
MTPAVPVLPVIAALATHYTPWVHFYVYPQQLVKKQIQKIEETKRKGEVCTKQEYNIKKKTGGKGSFRHCGEAQCTICCYPAWVHNGCGRKKNKHLRGRGKMPGMSNMNKGYYRAYVRNGAEPNLQLSQQPENKLNPVQIGGYLPSDDMDAAPVWVLNRAKEYFKNDMIFIPINMDDVHCYLCVINARKLCVQVLDSLGPSMNRKDLTDTLEGPENLFKYASEHMELKSNKWTDLSVTTWKREEYIKSSLETDGPWLLDFQFNALMARLDATFFSTQESVAAKETAELHMSAIEMEDEVTNKCMWVDPEPQEPSASLDFISSLPHKMLLVIISLLPSKFGKMIPTSLTSSLRTVKFLELEPIGPNLAEVVGFLRYFPSWRSYASR